jgi:hypothetical protein
MKHRHIEVREGEMSVAAIESILERGSDDDIKSLMRTIRANPFSHAADNALIAADHSDVYGYPEMIRDCISRWRAGHGAERRVPSAGR